MKFIYDNEQRDFAAALESLLSGTDTVKVARAWADGDHDPGRKLWGRLCELGVDKLIVAEDSGGTGATPVELVIAFEALGRHAVPGPWVETAAYLPVAMGDDCLWDIAFGGHITSVALPPEVPYAVDADVADNVFVVSDGALRDGTARRAVASIDPTRHLFEVEPAGQVAYNDVVPAAFDLAVLATAAQLLGAGERILADSVTYVKQRKQFGREIGSYQAIKHRLADVRIALDFARPLIDGAAVSISADTRARDVSAAKVAAGDAAYLAARVGLQVHGAIGYTAELDLSLWLLKVRALVNAWGTPAFHRSRVLESLVRR
jgi:alkylation response protein AidB-like acyl-CoA dehydrogenase